MLYVLKFALRYLASSKLQTGLLVLGVAIGVFVFVFISALIGGLGSYLVDRTVGDIAHVTLEAPKRDATLISGEPNGSAVVFQKATAQREVLRTGDIFLPLIEEMEGVKAASPQIVGNGFVIRGQSRAPVYVTGVEPGKVSAIADIRGKLVSGSDRLTNSSILIGASLASDLGVGVGQIITLQSDRDVERSLMIAGIFSLGVETLDARSAFVSIAAARSLFDLDQGISRIEIKLNDLNSAELFADRIAAATGLEATPWTENNAQLLDGLRAQANSGDLIKAFSLITIVIGVASALLLSTYRRRPEIGIMRAFGASRMFVVSVFVFQGMLVGLIGGVLGAGAGYLVMSPFPVPEEAASGGFPIDVRQGDYLLAIVLTVIGAIIASILPARAAAKVDPVEVIGQ
ncbi:ABC transporter permease [Aquamicrobium zhengzhouense]|uniref:ABC transporter permease n=1 Tax=Aquamicrobium zhengzhouense TaxID=2781738 RepID=A0ABS0SDF3_9HYPH|nr:FtsX-like permease family protein [Aquamicrobium zhengzhouense]MBI1621328.1 ABC transporter permease [Aquamicrobium zhengzhouense]